jgi:mannose-1-phosphate guanylyltransferase
MFFFIYFIPIYPQNYAVILAGGNGERLWPLSTSTKPKQLLSIDNTENLLEQTIKRIEPLIPKEHIWICATQTLYEPIASSIKDRVGRIVIEPDRRDTAAAILYSCSLIALQDPDATVLFIPSDAFIPVDSYQQYRENIYTFYMHAQKYNGITLFGIKPTYPATGYGYIEYNIHTEDNGFYSVRKFHEKPSKETASHYIASNNMLWNIGMFGGKVSTFIEIFKEHASDIFYAIEQYNKTGTGYASIRKVSVDYAILEKSTNIRVLPVSFCWFDVGSIPVFLSLQKQYKKQSSVIEVDSHNNLVSSPNLVALVGVNDLCVVQKDNIILIVHQNAAEKVKQIIELL